MAEFFSGLKSRSDETRLKAARNLQHFVSTELRELPAERYSEVLDEINQNIFSLMSSPELHEKKGGILAIGKYPLAESAEIISNLVSQYMCYHDTWLVALSYRSLVVWMDSAMIASWEAA